MRSLVASIRDPGGAGSGAVTDALLDAYLLRMFPGRTLEELDHMDWPRYLRAIEVNRVTAIEDRRRQFLAGDLDPTSLTAEDWAAIAEHDALMKQHTTRIEL